MEALHWRRRVCYQRGLSRLVFRTITPFLTLSVSGEFWTSRCAPLSTWLPRRVTQPLLIVRSSVNQPLQIVRLPPLEIAGTVRELELLGQLCVTNLQRLSNLNQRRNYVESDTNFATDKHLLLKLLFQTLCAVDDFRMEGDFPPLPAHRTELARLAEMFPGVEKAVVELVLEGVQVWILLLYMLHKPCRQCYLIRSGNPKKSLKNPNFFFHNFFF